MECLELVIGEPPQPLVKTSATASVPDTGVPVAEFVSTLADGPVAAMAELGRLIAQGAVVIDGNGLVLAGTVGGTAKDA